MNDMIVKSVDLMGDTVMAAQDGEGNIWAGVSYFCNALGMNKKQKDWQTEKVQSDKILSRGAGKFGAGVFDPNNETIALRIDFVPLWLTKISVTKQMEKSHPELADKLLEYQLKAKDILAAAFLPKQENGGDIQGQIKLLAQGTTELYQRVEGVESEVSTVKAEIEALRDELPLFPSEADKIKNAVNKRVVEILGGKESNSYKDRSLSKKVFANCYRNLKGNFENIGKYTEIKRKYRHEALKIVEKYEPPFFLAQQIESVNAQQSLDLEGGVHNA